jgi:dTDP-4-amino-4,6-dideoxygalactose transaminase
MEIKYLDLNAQYQSIKNEIDSAIQNVINSSAFALGPAVKEFEQSFAQYCDVKYCSGVNSGTNALLLALKALNVGSGDEVITSANTFIATISAIVQTGAKPVLVDVNPTSRNIDPLLLKMAISNKTRVIMPVHLYGRMSDMDSIMKIAGKNGINVLEDASQAHGAKYKGKKAGSIGRAATFSFYPGKNLGAYGEGGVVTTNDNDVDKMIKMLRDHGSEKKYYHDMVGYNARMDGIQGAVLNVKLRYLDRWNKRRREIAKIYSKSLKNVVTPDVISNCEQVFHLYVIEHEKRDELQQYLKEKYNIPTLIHYPIPNHLQKALDYLGYKKGDFPVTEKLSDEILSLPIYPEMTDEQVIFVSDKINEFTG